MTYDLFISYSHNNKAFARKLFRELVSYSPLFKINGKKKLSIFLDETEADSNDLNKGIITALKNSEKLIVICSQQIKKASWVEKEIQMFNEFHGKGKIIPILIDGDHFVSFPEILNLSFLSGEPWGIDFRDDQINIKLSKNKSSWYHLLSVIYGVSREKIEKRELRKKITWAVTGILVATIIAVTSFFIYHQQLVKDSIDLAGQAASPDQDFDVSIDLAIKALGKADTKQARDISTRLLRDFLSTKLSNHVGYIFSDKNNSLFIDSRVGNRILYNWKTGSKKILYRSSKPVVRSQFSESGNFLYTLDSENNIKIWHVPDGLFQSEIKLDLSAEIKNYDKIEFSPDDISIVIDIHNRPLLIWDVKTGRSIKAYKGLRSPIFYDTISKNIISSEIINDTIYTSNYRTGEQKKFVYKVFEGKVFMLDYDPKQRAILVSNREGTPKDSLCILYLSKTGFPESKRYLKKDLSDAAFLHQHFKSRDIRGILLSLVTEKYYDLFPCRSQYWFAGHEELYVSPSAEYLVGSSRCRDVSTGWFSTNPDSIGANAIDPDMLNQKLFVFRVSHPDHVDTMDWRYGDILNMVFSKDKPLAGIYSKLNNAHFYLTIWNIYSKKILAVDSSGIDEIISPASADNIIAIKYGNENEKGFAKKYDFQGNLAATIPADDFFDRDVISIDLQGNSLLVKHNYPLFLIQHFDLPRSPQKISFFFDESDLFEQDQKDIQRDLSRDQLLEIAYHWFKFK